MGCPSVHPDLVELGNISEITKIALISDICPFEELFPEDPVMFVDRLKSL